LLNEVFYVEMLEKEFSDEMMEGRIKELKSYTPVFAATLGKVHESKGDRLCVTRDRKPKMALNDSHCPACEFDDESSNTFIMPKRSLFSEIIRERK
jgi:hypothetical protein